MLNDHHMKTVLKIVMKCSLLLAVLAGVLLAWCGTINAQEVSTQISSREAWVGSPIVLQVQVRNAKKYSLPSEFEIDGCDVRSAGNPSQSSQIMIVNGRRSENRSVTQQYLIIPRREGKFQIPALEIKVDGETKRTRSISFVATQSETGDLLFVEVEGKKEAVFVGEPLDLTLKIWIKPFADRDNKIKLTESHMWQMLSEETSWGTFGDRLQELADNRQRPSGKSVLRENDDGQSREYYLYEIEGTVYPTKPGKIDASDLQIIVNYPISLGVRNSPFGSMFGGSAFGGSPFGQRLAITDSRPVSAVAKVNSTKVLAVPTSGQTAHYRGAVGRYQMVAEAEPKSVAAGDPITLRLGITGDGPMELVQAPPLHKIESLANDFQVSDQSLAGFVQDETKFFVTTIRPRSEGVTQIPAIPFSFFDPDKKAYATVYSQPISINVEKAETFQLDSIVSNVTQGDDSQDDGQENATNATALTLSLQNDFSKDVLRQESGSARASWVYYAIVPAIGWLILLAGKLAFSLPVVLGRFQSPFAQATQAIQDASSANELSAALRSFVARLTKSPCQTDEHAVGQLRGNGDYATANALESLFHKIRRIDQPAASLPDSESASSLDQLKPDCHQMISDIQQASRDHRTFGKRSRNAGNRNLTTMSLFLVITGLNLAQAGAAEQHSLVSVLTKANKAYQEASDLAQPDAAKSRDQFRNAAGLYQQLVDQGVRNSKLFFNLGNACYQSGDPGLAIVNYHRSLWLNPTMQKARKNLSLLSKQEELGGLSVEQERGNLLSYDGLKRLLLSGLNVIGWNTVVVMFAVASFLFWGLVALKTVKPRVRAIGWVVVPMLLMVTSGLALFLSGSSYRNLAIVTSDAIELRSGDGDEFPVLTKVESSAGIAVNVSNERQRWVRIELPNGESGWLAEKHLERVALRD